MKDQFVSRAGQKLQHALTKFNINVSGKVCADFGCNAGGFTDCLLQNGAKKIYAIDTGYGALDWNLRQNPKIVVMERTNALRVELPEKVDFISIDVGWTRQRLVIPVALNFLKKKGDIISLLKPQYEAPRAWLKAGKVKDEFLPTLTEKVKEELVSQNNLIIKDAIESPVTGKSGGNIEYLMWVKK